MGEGPRHHTLRDQMMAWLEEQRASKRTVIHQAPSPLEVPRYATLIEKMDAELGKPQDQRKATQEGGGDAR